MGTFDGVHLGHQKLLQQMKDIARRTQGKVIVITYYHHPLEIIHSKTFPYLLTEREEKEKLLRKYGVECVLYLNFNRTMARMSPQDFLESIIINEVNAKELVVGYDTHFGINREGNYNFLQEHASQYGYNVNVVEPYFIRNRIVSSSLIRDLIREGDVNSAAEYMGREYSLSGEVSTGHRIGRNLGFPTINVIPADANKLIPAIGVYVCLISIGSGIFQGVTNIGYSPTLKKTGIKEVESHIMDYDEDLYGKKVEVYFLQRLRDEKVFNSEHNLVKAIKEDIAAARRFFLERDKVKNEKQRQ